MTFKKVENKNRYKTAGNYYWYIKNGKDEYLFSESQMETAKLRAKKNPEDLPKHSNFYKSLDILGYIFCGFLLGGFVVGLVFATAYF
jgi:hypothetical protein